MINELDYQISLAKHYARPYIACTISLSILLLISLALSRTENAVSKMLNDDYVTMAIQFMDDKDAPDDKATRYYRAMHY